MQRETNCNPEIHKSTGKHFLTDKHSKDSRIRGIRLTEGDEKGNNPKIPKSLDKKNRLTTIRILRIIGLKDFHY